MPEQWKCTVCGYLYDGSEPPPRCPRCGADGARFIPRERVRLNLLYDLKASFVPHAVASHFPSGLIPAALLAMILALATGRGAFDTIVFYLLILAWMAVPVLVVSGITDWRKRFGGVKATIFYKKISLAAVLFLSGGCAIAIRLSHPDILQDDGILHGIYLGLVPLMVLCTVLLGHYGGKLAFQWKKRTW